MFPCTGLQFESSFLADHVHAIQRSTVLSVFLMSDVMVTIFIFGIGSNSALGLYEFLEGSWCWMLPSPQHFASIQPESHCLLADVDWCWVDGVEPLSVLFIAHCPFAWWDVVVILAPYSVRNEFYPWALGVVVLVAGVGLFKLRYCTYTSK